MVDLANCSDERASHNSRMSAGTRCAATKSMKSHWALWDRRVAAHRSDSAAVDSNDRFDILCNDHANRFANDAHALHGLQEDHRDAAVAVDV